MKRSLILFGILLGIILTGVAAFIANGSRDIPPPDVSDLVPEWEGVPTEENAFGDIQRACELVNWPSNGRHVRQFASGLTNDMTGVAEALAVNAEARAALSEGLDKPLYSPPTPHPATRGTEDQNALDLSLLLRAEIRLAVISGDSDHAVASCRDLLRLGSLRSPAPMSLVDYLLNRGVLNQGLRSSRSLVHSGRLSAAHLSDVAQDVASLPDPSEGLRQALGLEFACFSRLIDEIAGGRALPAVVYQIAGGTRSIPPPPLYRFKPNETRQVLRDYLRGIVSNADVTYSMIDRGPEEACRGFALGRSRRGLTFNVMGRELCRHIAPTIKGIPEGIVRTRLATSATQVLVALQRYRMAHGQLPTTLDALVPQFIAEVPRDPYDGALLRYDVRRGILWSVSRDLEDQEGRECRPVDTVTPGRNPWNERDVVFEVGEPSK